MLDVISQKLKPYTEIEKQLEVIFARYPKLGKIFKRSDFHILKAVCNVFSSSFEEAITHFLLAVQEKTQ